jgi:hypothetical protein
MRQTKCIVSSVRQVLELVNSKNTLINHIKKHIKKEVFENGKRKEVF